MVVNNVAAHVSGCVLSRIIAPRKKLARAPRDTDVCLDSAREAAARVLNPLSYPRFMEFDLALSQLQLLHGHRVLDVGSPKLAALLIARNLECELYATDIRDYFIGATSDFLKRLGQGDRLGRD